jgi:hypothetical protein
MAKLKLVYALALGVGLLLAGCGPQASIPQGVQVYFSPKGGATDAVANALDHATNSVLVQAYSFTSAPIAKALVDAHRRGIKVQVILDHSQRTEKYSEADFVKNSGIPTLIDAQHAIAHNKIMIIDECVVLTGSFNFTRAAEEHNAENLLVINDPVLAKQYIGTGTRTSSTRSLTSGITSQRNRQAARGAIRNFSERQDRSHGQLLGIDFYQLPFLSVTLLPGLDHHPRYGLSFVLHRRQRLPRLGISDFIGAIGQLRKLPCWPFIRLL